MVDVTMAMCPFKLLGTVVLFDAIPTICIRCQYHVVRMLTTMPIALRTATIFCVFLVSLFSVHVFVMVDRKPYRVLRDAFLPIRAVWKSDRYGFVVLMGVATISEP